MATMVRMWRARSGSPLTPSCAAAAVRSIPFVKTRQANLDIVERQESAAGEMTWVRAGKAPLKLADGTAFGILAMYEIVDAATGRTLFMQSMKNESAKA